MFLNAANINKQCLFTEENIAAYTTEFLDACTPHRDLCPKASGIAWTTTDLLPIMLTSKSRNLINEVPDGCRHRRI